MADCSLKPKACGKCKKLKGSDPDCCQCGRPTKFEPRYCKMLVDFFSSEHYREVEVEHSNAKGDTWYKRELKANDIPYFSAFARKIGVTHKTLLQWTEHYTEFREAYEVAKQLQEHFLIVNGLQGHYNAAFAIFTAKNILGWRDKRDVKHEGDASKPLHIRQTEVKLDGLSRNELIRYLDTGEVAGESDAEEGS